MQRVITEVMNLFRCGKLKVVRPTQVFSIENLESAFHGLQSGKTMGKVVIEPLPGQKVKVSLMGPRRSRKKLTLYQVMPTVSQHSLIRSDATYLITGGVGGLGRSMTKWLVQQGAKSIALLSRSGQASANAKVLTDEYSSTDVKIAILQCDVGEKDQVRKVIEVCSQSMPPIRGVIHGAMVLHVRSCLLSRLSLQADNLRQDMLFERTSIKEYRAIMKPKVQGVWNLHNLLPKIELDFFVMLSSAAGILRTRGQGVYAGTSTFLGAFSGWRQAQSLPASTIHLGAVAEVGSVAERSDRQAEISNTYGDKGLTEREFLAFLRASIENQHSDPEIYTSLALVSAAAGLPYWASDAKFAHLRGATIAGQDSEPAVADQAARSLVQLLKSADSLEAAQQAISGKLKTKLCSLLMVQEEDIDPSKAIITYGLDSLVAVEFRNWIAKEMGARIQLMEVTTSKLWGDLVALIASRSSLVDRMCFVQVNGGTCCGLPISCWEKGEVSVYTTAAVLSYFQQVPPITTIFFIIIHIN